MLSTHAQCIQLYKVMYSCSKNESIMTKCENQASGGRRFDECKCGPVSVSIQKTNFSKDICNVQPSGMRDSLEGL